MAYNAYTEFPSKTLAIDALDTTPVEVVALAATPIKVAGILVANQTANAAIVFLREVDNAPVFAEFGVPASTTLFFPYKASITNTEILATGTSVDVNVYIQVSEPTEDQSISSL
jgi:hypothetical protein